MARDVAGKEKLGGRVGEAWIRDVSVTLGLWPDAKGGSIIQVIRLNHQAGEGGPAAAGMQPGWSAGWAAGGRGALGAVTAD